MRTSPRIGTRLLAARGIFFFAAALALSAGFLVAPASAASPAPADAPAADAGALLADIRPVLAHAYPGLDTAALLARIEERLQWGEKDERLIEAEGILRFDRGEYALAVPCFKQLAAPGIPAMGLMAEALEARGEKYEAADWRLRAARALSAADPEAVRLYRLYLSVRPADERAGLELAARLDAQMQFGEACDLYWKLKDRLLEDTAAAARAADLLSVHGRLADAAFLVARLREARPGDRGLASRLAGIREAMGEKPAAAVVWAETWNRNPADTAALRRALDLLASAGDAEEGALRALLEKAMRQDGAKADAHYRLALLALKAGDRKAAYARLDTALRLSPGNPAYLARLPEAIEGDSLIRAHAALLEARAAQEPASPRLALLAARAYSLAGAGAQACGAWIRLAGLDPKALDGRKDAFLDLAGCGDSASLVWASRIGSRYLAVGFDREAARAMILIALKSREYAQAAGYAARLAAESPSDALPCLDAARALLAAGKEPEARLVLTALADHGPHPEAALLLGRLHMAAGEWAAAVPRLQAARDSFPEADPLLGKCLSEKKDFPGAASAYESHFARKGDKESLRAAARLRRLAGDGPKEAEALQTLEDSGWAGEGERLRLALAKASRGDMRGATAIYEDLFRGRAVLPRGEGGEAEDWIQAALQYGIQMARDGRLDNAIAALELGLKAAPAGTPGLAEPWLRLGECLIEKKQWREAYSAYAEALASDSASDEAAVEMLNAAKRFDGKEEVARAYRAVYRLDTLNADANASLAAAHQAAHEYRDAARHYRRVAEAHPADPQAWENLGNALAMIPDLKAASRPLQAAIDLGAQSDEVYINRARAYRAEGEKGMAASILHFLLTRNPRDYLAVLWSAKFAEEDGYADVASDLFRKTARLQAPRSSWPELTQARAQAPHDPKSFPRAD